jgi:predicted AlkP superfamily pyrophosphatase or phosphodiesterase
VRRTLVVAVNGLAASLIGDATPQLAALVRDGVLRPLATGMPALAGPVQATFTTGLPPGRHGIVGDRWYVRDLGEVRAGLAAAALVAGEKIWDAGVRRAPAFTSAALFWPHTVNGTATYTVAPRRAPDPAGRSSAALAAEPVELAEELTARLGRFPFLNAWGPAADVFATRWIGACARHVWDTRRPTLTLVSLPHLDVSVTRLGPGHPALRRDLTALDAVCGELIEHVRRDGARVLVVSAYGFTPVTDAIHVNRALREAKLLRVRTERGHEWLDAGASDAFAVADRQIAHVYLRRSDLAAEVTEIVRTLPGVDHVLGADDKRTAGLDHPRAGDLVAIARPDRWFSYYYWMDADAAPDVARTVDPDGKPGHDPVELFLDPAIRWPTLRVAKAMARRTLGLRYALDVIPLDATLVRGSHGRAVDDAGARPVMISSEPGLVPPHAVPAAAVRDLALAHVFA